jgi:predicted nuclease of restriction endonuclease-like (RecB) superfamily
MNTTARKTKTTMTRKSDQAAITQLPMNFEGLATAIAGIHASLQGAAAASVNRLLTMRNWLIGMYIVEYEQKGEDRAQYGDKLLITLSKRLVEKRIKGMSATNLKLFRQFYRAYPQILLLISDFLKQSDCVSIIGQLPTDQLVEFPGAPVKESDQGTSQIQPKSFFESLSADNQSLSSMFPSPENLIRHFSFTHFVELMRLSDPLKRAFYEIEGIKGCWSVPQLKRQIESLLFERTGLSHDKAGLVEAAHAQNRVATVEDLIRDPYILEFTGLPERSRYSESDLETALLDHIQSFLLELGNGFCFEARQKRITLDNEHDRIDLVFYHRILRCHVLIDLKVRKFQHGDAGQMNFYLSYYREHEMIEGDNQPVGLILCTDRDETRVKYATAGLDNRLFVSKYLTALPSEEQIRVFLESDRSRTETILREEAARYGE